MLNNPVNVELNGMTDREVILKIADLMEQGSQGMEQTTGRYIHYDGSVCAMGACLKAAGVSRDESKQPNFNTLTALGLVTWPQVVYPVGAQRSGWLQSQDNNGLVILVDAIICLNDVAGWNFEHIINWLRSLTAAPEGVQNA